MANKKEYTVKINGIDTATKQVEELNSVINEFNKKIKDKGKEKITVNVDSSQVDDLNEKIDNTIKKGKEFEDQFTNFTIDIGGVTYEFDNITQAIGALDDRAQGLSATLAQMREDGEDTTEEFQKLSKEFDDLVKQSAKLERARKYSDDLRDSLASQTRTLDLVVQGFTAFGNALQIASGISGLFGKSQEEIEESINRTVQIMAIVQAAQELYNQAITQGTVINKAWTVALSGADKVMKMFGASTVATSTAMKGLKLAIASTGIGLLVVAIGELVSWLGKLASSSDDAKNNLNKISDLVDRRLTSSIQKINQQKELGLISEFEALNKQIVETTKAIDEFNRRTKNIKGDYSKLLNDVAIDYASKVDSGKFYDERQTDHYMKLLTKLNQQGMVTSMTIEDLNKLLNETGQGLNEFNVDNIKLDGYDENQLEILKQYYNQSREYYNKIYELKLQQQIKNKELNDQITDLNIQNIKNDRERELAEINKKYDDLRKTVEVSEQELANIQRKANYGDESSIEFLKKREELIKQSYERQKQEISDINKSYAEEEQNIQNQITNNRIAAMQDGYAKELAALQQAKKEEIQAAIQSETNVNEQIKAINEKYNRELINLNKTYYDERIQLLEDYKQEVLQIEREVAESQYDVATSKVQRESSNKQESLSYSDVKYYPDSNLTDVLNTNLTNINDYYNQVYNIASQSNEKLKNINLEKALFDFDSNKEDAKKQLEDRLKTLDEALQKQVISQETYDKQKQDLNDAHNQKMLQMEREYNEEVLQIENDYNNKRLSNEANFQSSQIDNLKNQINQITKLRSELNQPINIGDYDLNALGNVAKGFIDTNQFKEVFAQLNTDIDNQMKQLQAKFDSGEISFGDFKKMKAELEGLKEANQKTLDALEMNWQDWAQNIATIGAAVVNMWSSIFSGIANMQYQNEMNRIEQEQELLDEELEMLEEQYEKQQEIYQQHADNISSIEEELATARGDRRDYLVEQLGAEMNAQEQAWAAQQEIDRQKQAAEKKQEALEKQKEAAERKRNNAQKKVQIAQATANTALAVTNALAVQPWFLGVALAAVAAAMGAAQIAILAKTKYADGGLLQGKSHAQGGIPVGNTGIEVEGNEYVINKKSTKANLPLINYINSNRRHLTKDDIVHFFDTREGSSQIVNNNYFAQGGQIPNSLTSPSFNPQQIAQQSYVDDRPIYVSVQEIERVSNNVRNVQALAGL